MLEVATAMPLLGALVQEEELKSASLRVAT
jgi:hypothetical protein